MAILNPYNEREHGDDKLSIVDIKARDDQGRLAQIEIQLLAFPDLPARILYGWAELYRQQLQVGDDYDQLQPAYAIWLLAADLVRDDHDYLHRYRLRDDQGRGLLDHGGIWLLELNKFRIDRVVSEQQRWLKFFKDGERLDAAALPDWMQTDEMRQAMTTLQVFSDKERSYHAYQARLNFLRQQRSLQRHLDAERAAKEAALREKADALQAKEAERHAKETALEEKAAALAEIARLTALLQDRPPADPSA